MLTPEEKKALADKIGEEATKKVDADIKAALKGVDESAKKVAEEAIKNGNVISKETFDDYQTKAAEGHKEVQEILKKQGMTMTQLLERMGTSAVKAKGIAETLTDHAEEIHEISTKKSGTMEFMLSVNEEGKMVMKKFERNAKKAVGPHATVDGAGGNATVSSITSSLDGAAILRLAGNVPIISAYRNTPFLMGVANLVNKSFSERQAIWIEEVEKVGSSALVAEGQAKPRVQYEYILRSVNWKKQAQMLSFTDEFDMDFAQLESDILGKGIIDLMNDINDAILPDVIAKATPYNTGAQFTSAGTGVVPNVNDYDVIVALATQVKNSTYGTMANGALMSTFKEGRMAVLKDAMGSYLNRPAYLDNVAFIGNREMQPDAVVVGDFKNYDIFLRGGIIVRIGYNGNDFQENKFSVVQEQYYFGNISELRRVALVKGPDFSDVAEAIGA